MPNRTYVQNKAHPIPPSLRPLQDASEGEMGPQTLDPKERCAYLGFHRRTKEPGR